MISNIAILDDSPMMAAFFNRQLGKEHNLSICTQPLLALKHLMAKKPDLILLDWGFSTNKHNLLKSIRRRRELANIPIIAISGNTSNQFRQECLALGVNDVLLKPFQPQELRYAVKDQLAVKMYTR